MQALVGLAENWEDAGLVQDIALKVGWRNGCPVCLELVSGRKDAINSKRVTESTVNSFTNIEGISNK